MKRLRSRSIRTALAMATAGVVAATAGGSPPLGDAPASTSSPLDAASSPWWSDAVTAALDRAGARRAAWTDALLGVPAAHRSALAFLLEHMPVHDLESLDPDFILADIALACEARAAVPWGADLPEDVFLNDVLPYASISERRDPWRADLRARFLPLALECDTPAEAAHRLNQQVFPELGVRYSTERARADQSPAESVDSGVASCTGLSILLVDACRAVGVPARLAGIPNWTNKRGNHTWVEIWDGGTWHFAGAAEPDPKGLNHAWFVGDAALARRDVPEHAIYAISYRRTGVEFPVVFTDGAPRVPAVNVTDRYARRQAPPASESRLLVDVTDAGGARVAAAVTVRGPDEATPSHRGFSRDGSFDTNDVLAFTVDRGERWEVEARHGDAAVRGTVETTAPEHTVVLVLDPGAGRSPALAPGSAADPAVLGAWGADPTKPIPAALDRLVLAEPARARALAWDAYRRRDHARVRADFDAHRVRYETHESPYVARRVGVRPANGWPLVIAMHGGGGAPPEVNDRQWRQMQRYYRDQPDLGGYVYLALRAPNDTWNGFYDDYVYPLVTNLIRQFLLFGDVDPDRVFLIGYSHGGYGALAIGPKIPHRFAAIHASAAAPTDGESVARGLRTTPFTYMIGEHDHAYGRRERCEAFDRSVVALRGDRDDVYPVVMEYESGVGHGGLPDRDKIRDLYPHVRNPCPRELSWEMTDTVVREHFWLSVPEAARGRIIEATCGPDNTIDLDVVGVPRLTLHLDERLIDPRSPVTVRIGELSLVSAPVPSMRELLTSLGERGDPALSWSMRIDVDVVARSATPSRP